MSDAEPLVYTLDACDRIVRVNDAWTRFTLENDAPELAAEHVLRRSIWDFLDDPTTRQIYADRRTIRSGSLLRACAWCKRVDVGGEWLEIDVALEPLRIFELKRLSAVTHGICDACHQTMTIVTSL